MNWYKNARTSNKLMLAFGVLAAMLAAVGYEGFATTAASRLNSSLDTLYEVHMLGAAGVADVKSYFPHDRAGTARVALAKRSGRAPTECADYSGGTVRRHGRDHGRDRKEDRLGAKGKADVAKFKRLEPQYREMVLEIARLAVGQAG